MSESLNDQTHYMSHAIKASPCVDVSVHTQQVCGVLQGLGRSRRLLPHAAAVVQDAVGMHMHDTDSTLHRCKVVDTHNALDTLQNQDLIQRAAGGHV